MKFCCKILPLLFLLFFSSLHGQNVVITGSGSGYSGAVLRFYSLTDPFSKRLKPLFQVRCDSAGNFSCQIPCTGRDQIFIKTGIFNFNLIIECGGKYNLSLPVFVPKSGSDEHNPFFSETNIFPVVTDNPFEINNRISNFDSVYNPVFNKIAESAYIGYKKNEISQYIKTLDKFTGIKEQGFFADYVKYRMAMLYLVSKGNVKSEIDAEEFIDKDFNPDNPACCDLAGQVYSGYFATFETGPKASDFIKAINNSSYSDLKTLIKGEGRITNNQLADFIILLNLYNNYYSKTLPGAIVRKIVLTMSSEASTLLIKEYASAIYKRMQFALPGSNPPDFYLSSNTGKKYSIKDFSGKFLILCFMRSDEISSMQELSILNMWVKKYLKTAQVVAVLTDKDFNIAALRMKNSGEGLLFLDGSSAEMLEYDYDIRLYPSFILIDTRGKIISNPAPYPSENLEHILINNLQTGLNLSDFKNR